MNRFELWVLAGVAWWVTAMVTFFVVYGAWVAATSEPTAWLLVALLLPGALLSGVLASRLSRDAREAP